MSILFVLGALFVLIQGGLAIGWFQASSRLLSWTASIDKGLATQHLTDLTQKFPLLSQDLQRVLVDWRGKPHVREPSGTIVNVRGLEAEKGQSLQVLPVLAGMVLVITLAEAIAKTSEQEWELSAMTGLTVLSLWIAGFVSQRVHRSVLRCRLALDSVCPLLPSADNVTREVMEQLQKQMKQLSQGQQESLDSLGKSQDTLAKLGENLQFAFQKSIQEQLSPALTELSQVASSAQQANQKYVEETTRKQSQVVQALIVQVMDGIDQAIGQSLRDTSESFASSVQRQQVSMDRWRRSVESVADVIGALEKTTQGVTLGAERMALAAQPVEAAARVFSESAQELQKVFPVVSQLGDLVLKSQNGLNESHSAIQRGTAEYLQVTGTIRSMVDELSKAHEKAIARVSKGVEESLVQPFGTMSAELQMLQGGQVKALEQMQQMMQTVEQSLHQIHEGHQQLSTLASQIQQAGEPSVQAAASLVQVTEQLERIAPQLAETTQIHEVGAQTLQTISAGLQDENNRNEQILSQVQQLVHHLDSTQQQMAERVSKGIDGALAEKLIAAREQFVTDVTSASKALQNSGVQIAERLDNSSQNLVNTLDTSGKTWEKIFKKSGEELGASLTKTGSDINVSLTQVRQQLSDTMSDANKLLSQSLHQASQTFIQDWGSMGQSIQDALQHASQSLDQSVQEVGRKLNQRIDEAGQSLEQSVQQSANLLEQGAGHAHAKLGQVGDGWSTAIKDASQSLRGNAEFASQTISKTLTHAQTELATHLQHSLERVETQMQARLEEAIRRQQGLLEQANVQQTQAANLLTEVTKVSTEQLHTSVQQTQQSLQSKLSDFGTDLQVSLQEIFQQYQNGLLQAARQQELAGQSLSDQAQEAGQKLQNAMVQAQEHTRQALDKMGTEMVLQLGQIHKQYSDSMDRSQASMSTLVSLQEGHIGGWQELVQTLTPALGQLNGSAVQLDQVVQRLQDSMGPATTVSANFVKASSQLQAVFPNISETANSYHQFNESLQKASLSLSSTANQYQRAGGDMGTLLSQIEQSLGLQNQSNHSVSSTLQGVQRTIDSLEPLVQLMQQASQDMRVVSEGSTNTIDTMKQATESQNQSVQQMGKLSAQLLKTLSEQGGRLGALTTQMEQLQHVLTIGVDAFAQKLPQSVDGTLLQFDAVLAEGVLRINGSIERLREAMDDLIEQMDRK